MTEKPILHPLDFSAMFRSNYYGLLDSIKSCGVVAQIPAGTAKSFLIGTHDGNFHCDEALALGMLQLHPTYTDKFDILRTRKPDLLEKCNLVVDVGAVYDASKHRYDHHQREFQDCFGHGFKTRLSSAGLVYKHFGKDILRNVIQTIDSTAGSDEFVDICYLKVYKDFMEHIDAIDNGVSVADGEIKYHVSTTLSSRVGRLNPAWNEPQTSDVMNTQFQQAMLLTTSEFIVAVEGLVKSWWPGRSIVQNAIATRHEVHPSGKIIIFSQACPWKDHLFDMEQSLNIEGNILYSIYQDTGGSWRIQAVPKTAESFESRKKLPEIWCGLRDNVLSEKSGVEGCIFIHASGFIGGHQSKEGVMRLASLALEL